MNESTISMVRMVVLLLAAGPLVYYLLSLYCTIQYFRSIRKLPARDDSFAPPVSILKAVRGMDCDAYENFVSYCHLDYPEYELVFAMADPHDPVIPVIEKLQRDFPNTSIRFVTDVPRIGENNKVNSLCRLVREARHDLLVMTDSDVRVNHDYLREVVAPFADHGVGAVTSFYRCLGGGTIAADLDMLGMCMDSVPSALVARRLEGNVQFAYGWTMATTKERLREVGGWEAMANHHSDDFELGNRIAAKGHRVELMRQPVCMVFGKQSFGDLLRHELRWAIGLRNVRPVGYAGMIFALGLPWSILAAVVAAGSGYAGLSAFYLGAYLVLRIGLAYAAGVWGLRDRSIAAKFWLAPVRDAVSAAVWFAGLFTDRIEWRGLEYRVRNRLLEPIEHASVTNLAGQGTSVRGIK
jgi:ceramide glucosyltransferase